MGPVRLRESVEEQDLLPQCVERESRPCRKTIGGFRKRRRSIRTEVAVGPDRELTIALVDRRVEEASCPIVGNESGSSPWSTAQITLIGAFHVPCKKRCTVATSQHPVDRKTSKQIRGLAAPPHHRGASAVAASAISATGSAVATDQRSSPRRNRPRHRAQGRSRRCRSG